ncbi:MAG: polyphosphate kinase 1 [Flavobacteriales bacterium]|nr:polyphosphate kinase 1 [Flavobacteriales bacterium]
MKKYYNREISWLSFNYRVLQEAINKEVPLIERLRFLAIYSSNLDEFYRVRVASYIHILQLQKKQGLEQDLSIKKLLKKIKRIVHKQQVEFGKIFREELIPLLSKESIFLVDQEHITKDQYQFLKAYFDDNILPHIKVKDLNKKKSTFLKNKGEYLTVEAIDNKTAEKSYYLINIPTDKTDRFIILPSKKDTQVIIQVSDVMRLFIGKIFSNISISQCFSVKLTRDAELYLEEEIAETIEERISSSLHKRDIGDPSRFLYDEQMPKEMLKVFRKKLGIKKNELIPGGRYHNFNDFFGLPIKAHDNMMYEHFDTLNSSILKNYNSYFDAISKKDVMLHFPYQNYDHVLEFIEEAAIDPLVEETYITLYRVAKESRVCKAMINAVKKGKKVTVFNEVKARFDEELNMEWGEKMKAAGVNVLYSFDEIKVHSKICLIKRREGKKLARYAYFGTGNFNEATAKIYCDHALLTKNEDLTKELENVFDFLIGKNKALKFKHLLVAPFTMRNQFEAMIDDEIRHVREGNVGKMVLKMNSLEDKQMINKLYEASNAGVKITIIVRGICCLIPGVEEMSMNIKVISIIDRYLEHGRIYIFNNNGNEKMFLASADWMKRNLSRRVEVGFPILDKDLKAEIKKLINLQLKDNVKARRLNKTQSNPYKTSTAKTKVRAQYDFYNYLKMK